MNRISRKTVFMCALLAALLCLPVSAQASAKKAKYTIKTYEETINGPVVTGNYSYQRPKLKGTSKAVKKINDSLKALYKENLETKKRFEGYVNTDTMRSSVPYNYNTTCKVTYNKNGIVCFCFATDWWAGGTSNVYRYGASYNLKTGKKLYLNNVVSGSKSKIRTKIVNAYVKVFNYTRSAEMIRNSLSYTAFKDFIFWLQDGKVYVNNGSYAPGGGNGEVVVELKGNYK